ncbi:unnamed protein product [Enterobius vermicularis]|uniref:Uncharacterized protein n=1 Tax=Enterobius vermicularis TaxID=51028 RepID=A0A0N4V887_ENTVE|nr:unnamed protein product [Enterobius vermicularis]
MVCDLYKTKNDLQIYILVYCFSFSIVIWQLLFSAKYTEAQALNDPLTQYIEGRLGNRRIWWCPSGYGYLAYCPQPTDYDNYNWCCTFPYMRSWKPSCCAFAVPTGALIAIIIAAITLVAVLVALSCWCCFCCPLYKQLYDTEDEK